MLGHKAMKVDNKVIPPERAAHLLHGMLPDPEPNWRKKIFSPDYVIDHARALGADVTNTRVPDWEQHTDQDLVDMLLARDLEFDHDILVVTDLCLGASPPGVPDVGGAFLVNGGELREFIAAYRKQLTPHFIDGDVLLASPGDGKIQVFHHEGMVSCINLVASHRRKPYQI